jgi:hypothetical protein
MKQISTVTHWFSGWPATASLTVGAAAGPVAVFLASASQAGPVVRDLANYGGVGILAIVLYRLYVGALKEHRSELAEERRLRHEDNVSFNRQLGRLADAVDRLTAHLPSEAT